MVASGCRSRTGAPDRNHQIFTTLSAKSAANTDPMLRLLSVTSRPGTIGNFWFVDGEVENVSPTAFDRIEALLKACDQDGTLDVDEYATLAPARLGSGR